MIDLISRQAAMDEMSKQQTYKMFVGEDTVYLDANNVGSVLASLPSAQLERKKGRWVPGRKIGKEILTDGTIAVVYEDYKCSSCGLILFRLLHNSDGTPFYKFCPNCGAWMGGEKEESPIVYYEYRRSISAIKNLPPIQPEGREEVMNNGK